MRGAADRKGNVYGPAINFYSRASCEARRLFKVEIIIDPGFLLTRLMRGAATSSSWCSSIMPISTHAPHARRGKYGHSENKEHRYFYSRASCEARPESSIKCSNEFAFLLTRLMRGAAIRDEVRRVESNFYSRASCEARRMSRRIYLLILPISTHAPHARRGAAAFAGAAESSNFYSRASCEARLAILFARIILLIFLLTRLMRGAAGHWHKTYQPGQISTHAPHARRGINQLRLAFQMQISTHAPHARRGALAKLPYIAIRNFYSRASCEARQGR